MASISMDKVEFPDNVSTQKVHPQRFALWIGIASMIMSFAGLTSAYLVRRSAGNWTEFTLPDTFWYSAIFMVASSFTIWFAARAFKKESSLQYQLGLTLTVTLGIAFMACQYLGWQQMQEIGIYLDGNPSGSFVYVLSGMHIVHFAVGYIILFITWLKSFFVFSNKENFSRYKSDPNKRIRVQLLATYWHFVDLLWLYLLIFFMYA